MSKKIADRIKAKSVEKTKAKSVEVVKPKVKVIKPVEENNAPFRIVVQFKMNDFKKLDLLITATDWMHSNVKDYWYKVVKETADSEYIYVHISHEEFKNNKITTEAPKITSYNSDYKAFKKTKKIARNVLFVPTNLLIDKIDKLTGSLLLDKIEVLAENIELFLLKVSTK